MSFRSCSYSLCRYAEVNHIEMVIVLCSRISYRKEMVFDRINPKGKQNEKVKKEENYESVDYRRAR